MNPSEGAVARGRGTCCLSICQRRWQPATSLHAVSSSHFRPLGKSTPIPLTGLVLLGIVRPPYYSGAKRNVGRLRQVNKKSAPGSSRTAPLAIFELGCAAPPISGTARHPGLQYPVLLLAALLTLPKTKLGSYNTCDPSFLVFLHTFKVGLHLQPCRSLKGVFFDIVISFPFALHSTFSRFQHI
ncbi:hypothetical protein B0J14DRAFT_74831 [Halenospora varia]|nr:hypothetical protein B0J14DRAFT_74831 [Halenospora varia]